MLRAFGDGSAFQRDAKEYTAFCRFHRLFLVDGIERWRAVLRDRGLSENEIAVKVATAMELLRRLGEHSADLASP